MDVLEEIYSLRKEQVAQDKKKISPIKLAERISELTPAKNIISALNNPGKISLIAESKRKSPSAGALREPYDVKAIVQAYEKGGASAVSVLTEPTRFLGHVGDLKIARNACSLPILRKDFIFDFYQILEARAYQADAVLLIAEMLSATQLRELVDCAIQNGIEPLVEFFSEKNAAAVIDSKARLIGINTRDLRTLKMVPDNVKKLAQLLPADRVLVAESGIKNKDEINELKSINVSAVLVGESLLRQENLEQAVRNLVSTGK